MIGTTGTGWLFSLAKDPESNWGAVEDFYNCVSNCEMDGDHMILESPVWGTLQSTEFGPSPGDGFAFYHSTRAEFPPNDIFGRKPRISLMGELLDVDLNGRDLEWIRVAVHPAVVELFRQRPIVRDDSTKKLFEDCGIVQGAVATLYRADSSTWRQLVSLIAHPANDDWPSAYQTIRASDK